MSLACVCILSEVGVHYFSEVGVALHKCLRVKPLIMVPCF